MRAKPAIASMLPILLFLASVTLPLACNAASVTRVAGGCGIHIQGEIDNSTLGALKSAVTSASHLPECAGDLPAGLAYLSLDSGGGDLEAAIAVGDFVRKTHFTTIVRVGEQCASACVLIYLAGVQRSGFLGRIGLHRPFSTKFSDTEPQAQAEYDRANRMIREYLTRMNIPVALLDAMNAVPPGEIRWLDDDSERAQFHIDGQDPAYADMVASRFAKLLGISKTELVSRQQRMEPVCRPFLPACDASASCTDTHLYDAYSQCKQDVLYGKR